MGWPIPVLTSRDEIDRWADEHAGAAFVPTMGALHEGHAALVRQAAGIAHERALPGVAVSVFVNPTQFDDPRDYERYPKTLDADVALSAAAGATAIIAPEIQAVYPTPESRRPPGESDLPRVATAPGLEDAYRPGHFSGVVMVVARLFSLVRPSVAVFGEKDWQQLQVVSAMVREPERFGTPAVGIVAARRCGRRMGWR
ncbi:MAG: pantoate--beta-alanine ligase [Phycisphaerales bacterium]